MKKLLLSMTLALVALASYATGQVSDVIYIDGTKWELLGSPVSTDSVLRRELGASLPKERDISTANWKGYTAYWSIRQKELCLDSITYEVYDGSSPLGKTESLASDVLLRVFKRYADKKGRIVAAWFNGDIRVARGKVLYYVHSGYERNYETEQILAIKKGAICNRKEYNNYVVDGFSFDKGTPNFQAEIHEKFPLHIERYPELAGVKRIMFSVKKARVDAQGHLVECEVKVLRPDDNPRLAAEMAEAMKAYSPWRVFYINGEYRALGIEHYTIPYVLSE